MFNIQILLGYLIIHLLCVVYMFNMFNHANYESDEIDYWLVWLFAPEFLLMVFVCSWLKERRK